MDHLRDDQSEVEAQLQPPAHEHQRRQRGKALAGAGFHLRPGGEWDKDSTIATRVLDAQRFGDFDAA